MISDFKNKVIAEIEAGRVRCHYNSDKTLTGLNYTETCQFDKLWNETNLICRGLVIDSNYNIVAMPFGKFFNFEEWEDRVSFDPDEVENIFTKEDGSLIICFYWDGKWNLSTRGSFYSEQSVIAKKIWDASENFAKNAVPGETYLFELVGPSNKNVIRSYEKDEIILLSAFNADLSEKKFSEVLEISKKFECNVPKTWKWSEQLFSYVKKEKNPSFEGIVVQLKDGTRFKLKSELYCHLHKVLTGEFTPSRVMDIWLCRKNDPNWMDPLIPDEWYSEVKQHLSKVDEAWYIELSGLKEVYGIMTSDFVEKNKDSSLSQREIRKYFALTYKNHVKYLDCLFSNAPFEKWEKVLEKTFSKV